MRYLHLSLPVGRKKLALLFQKMDEASAAIKRDIVFAASLYVS